MQREKRCTGCGWWWDAQKVSSCAGSLPPSPLHVQIQIDIGLVQWRSAGGTAAGIRAGWGGQWWWWERE